MRSIVFVFWLLAAPVVFAQEERSARQVLDDCIESVADDVIGMPALEAQCPGLEQALVELDLAPFVSDREWHTIGVYGLMTLQSVAARYSEPPPPQTAQVESLRSILNELRQPVQAERAPSWLERFQRWLRELMARQESAKDSWWSRWVDGYSLTETGRAIVFYGALALVLLLAAAVIVNEVRVARKGRRKRLRAGMSGDAEFAADVSGADSFDLEGVARSERPSLLLRMLVATLVKTGRLQAERSLTHRELTARARFDDVSQRQSFQRVAQLAERVVYGGDEAPAELDEVLQAGRDLQSQLSGANA